MKIKVVFGFYEQYEDYLVELRNQLLLQDRRTLIDTLNSVSLAVYSSSYKENISFIKDLLELLVTPLQWKIVHLMGDIFDVLKDFIKYSNLDLSNVNVYIYNSLQYVLDISVEKEVMKTNDLLVLKQKSISLAATMHKHCLDNEKDIPKILLDWKEVSESVEEFGDIRNCWI